MPVSTGFYKDTVRPKLLAVGMWTSELEQKLNEMCEIVENYNSKSRVLEDEYNAESVKAIATEGWKSYEDKHFEKMAAIETECSASISAHKAAIEAVWKPFVEKRTQDQRAASLGREG